MRTKSILVSVFFLFALSQNIVAEMIIIEADDYELVNYPAGTDIGPNFPQFDFIACSPDNTIYAIESTRGYGQLGANVLGCFWDDYWTYPSQLHIKIEDGYAKSVSLLVHESTEAEGNVNVWLRVHNSSNQILEEAYVQAPNTDHPSKTLSITRDDYDIARAEIYMGDGGDSICLDHIEILLNPKQVLTVQTEPNFVDTVDPNVGEHIYHLNSTIELSTESFSLCPDVYQFDHWEGDVNDVNDPNTTIIMDSNETVTAVFAATRECGDACHPNDLFGDYNHDCIIDFNDFANFALNWMVCTKPECD